MCRYCFRRVNNIPDSIIFQSQLAREREQIKERIARINESLAVIDYNPGRYIRRTDWIETFGPVETHSLENWGKIQSRRVFYRNGAELEFGITGLDWAALPPDPGTAAVLGHGCSGR